MHEKGDDVQPFTMRIGGGVSGQVAAGQNITQQYSHTGSARSREVTEEDLRQFSQLVAQLKARVVDDVPVEQQGAALERLDELADAVVGEKPDPTTMQYVRNWFGKHFPKLVGAITSLIVHPLVGKLVEAGGDMVAAEFKRYFGAEADG